MMRSETPAREAEVAGAPPFALEIEGITKRFGGVVALDAVSLALSEGGVLGLIGPNGAGKTTLLNVISGFVRQEKGAMRIGGCDVSYWPAHRLAAEGGISRTFQNIRMFQGMSVLENVLTGYHARMTTGIASALLRSGRERAEERRAREAAAEVLHSLGLLEFSNRQASQLAYGIQRRVEIARALVSAPRLLLLDEPTAGMTPRETNEIMGLLQTLRGRHVTMVVVEHKAGFIMSLCDRVAVLDFGTVIADGPPEAVKRDQKVIEAYLGSEDGDP